MFGVKQLFILLLLNIAIIISLPVSAQNNKTSDPYKSTEITSTKFTFEMPPGYQTDLPQDKAKLEPKPEKTKVPFFDFGFLGPTLQIIFYGILALAVLYILFLIINTIVVTKRSAVKNEKAEELPDVPTYQPDAETARILLDDADALAAQGKFAEAVHILLFRSIQDIEDKRPHHIKRSLTSREIAHLSILTPKARAVFSQIGKLVEKSFFGGGHLNVEDYQLSKSAYKAFAFENLAHSKPSRFTRTVR